MSRQSFYVIRFLSPRGWQYSRTFGRLAVARKWAKRLGPEAAIFRNGPGGSLGEQVK